LNIFIAVTDVEGKYYFLSVYVILIHTVLSGIYLRRNIPVANRKGIQPSHQCNMYRNL
jgi:hypothetical protein